MRLPPDARALGFAWSRAAERLIDKLAAHPNEVATLHLLNDLTGLLDDAAMDVDLSRVQNRYYELLHRPLGTLQMASAGGDETARAWWADFRQLGDRLRVRVG